MNEELNRLIDICNFYKNDKVSIRNYIVNLNNNKFIELLNNSSSLYQKQLILYYCSKSVEKKEILLNSITDEELLVTLTNEDRDYNTIIDFIVDNYFLSRALALIPAKNIKEFVTCLFVSPSRIYNVVEDDAINRILSLLDCLTVDELINLIENDAYISSSNKFPNTFWQETIFRKIIDLGGENIIFSKMKLIVEKDNSFKIIYEFLEILRKIHYYPIELLDCVNDSWLEDIDFIRYINDVVKCEDENAFDLNNGILKNKKIAELVSVISIKESFIFAEFTDYNSARKYNTEQEVLEVMEYISNLNYDDFREEFLADERIPNLLIKLNCDDLLHILPFNLLYVNIHMKDMLKQFFKKFLSYEKAIFLIDKINISDQEKIEIINSVYTDKRINNINIAKNMIIEENFNKILNLEMPISNDFKAILPDLIELPYNEDFFNKLKKICLNINCTEYLQIYISQLTKYAIKTKGLDVNSIEIVQYDGDNKNADTYAFWKDSKKLIRVYYDRKYCNFEKYKTDSIIKKVTEVIFHEIRHGFQYQKMKSEISFDALMCNLEFANRRLDKEYYDNYYYDIYFEVDARIHGVYETFKFLEGIDKSLANNYLKDNSIISENTASLNGRYNKENLEGSHIKEYIEKLKNDKDFIEDRKKSKSIEYFCNLINIFFNNSNSKEKNVAFRNLYKTIELITDETGRFYTPSEIKAMRDNIKNYSTNDIEFDKTNRDIKLFYTKYLYYLRCAIEKNLINIDGSSKLINADIQIKERKFSLDELKDLMIRTMIKVFMKNKSESEELKDEIRKH